MTTESPERRLERMEGRIPSFLKDLRWVKHHGIGYDKQLITDEAKVHSGETSRPTEAAAVNQEPLRSDYELARQKMKEAVEAFEAGSAALGRVMRRADNRTPRENDPFPSVSPQEKARLEQAQKRRQARGEDVA